MSENPKTDRGKCRSCGFLSKRTKGGFGNPPATDYEATEVERDALWELIAECDRRYYGLSPNTPEILARYFDAHPESFPK